MPEHDIYGARLSNPIVSSLSALPGAEGGGPPSATPSPAPSDVANREGPRALRDRGEGALLGHAIGDALGLGTEFLSRELVREWYPEGLRNYTQIVRDAHRSKWRPGEATDDTGQMLALAGVLADVHETLPTAPTLELDFARALDAWVRRDPRGLGKLTVRVLCDRRFTQDPLGVAREVHARSNGRAASNGSLMRVTPVGVACWRNPVAAAELGERTSRVSHSDPRCVDACRVVGWSVSRLVAGAPREDVLDSLPAVAQLDETRSWIARARAQPPEALGLDEGTRSGEENRIGYVGFALAAGISALAHAQDFEDGLLAVVHAGGDADTNGAIAGGLLGAWAGASGLPAHWIDGLVDAGACRVHLDRLLA